MKKIITGFLLLFSYFVSVSQTDDFEEFNELIQEFPMGNSVYSQEQGQIQLTPGFNFFNFESSKTFAPNLTFEYGFTDRFQIEIGTTYDFLLPEIGDKINGIGNSEVGLLYNIINKKTWAISASVDVGLPTADKKFGDPEIEYEPTIIGAVQINKLQIHSSFGLGFSDEDPEFIYNLSAVLPVNNVRAMLEFNSLFANEINETGETELSKNVFLTPGIAWIPAESTEFTLGTPIQIAENEAQWGIVVKITFEFGLFNKD